MNQSPLNRAMLNSVFLNGAKAKGKGGGAKYEAVTMMSEAGEVIIRNAKANSVSSLIANGRCEQYGTPTPQSPVRIYNNQGALLRVDEELPVGYARLTGIVFNDDSYFAIDGFRLKGSDTLKVSFTANKACNIIGAYTTADADDNYSIFASTTSGAKYLRYNGGTYLSHIVAGQRYDITITPTGCTGFASKSSWAKKDFTTSVDMLIGSTSVGATSAKMDGVIHGNIEVVGRAKFIPCLRASDGVVGYYDAVSGKFYAPTVGTPVMEDYDLTYCTYAEIISNGDRILSYEGVASTMGIGLVNIESLNAVNEAIDTQNIITGEVTRRVKVVILTGNENYKRSTTYGLCYYIQSVMTSWGVKQAKPLCTHFKGIKTIASETADGSCGFSSSGHIYFKSVWLGSDSTIDDFKAWVKLQYASGNPVILYLEASAETTENVAPQALPIVKGTNRIERPVAANAQFEITYLREVASEDVGGGGQPIEFVVRNGNQGNEWTYTATEGMTWEEWCDSWYNTNGFYYDVSGVCRELDAGGWFTQTYRIELNGVEVSPTDVIQPNATYYEVWWM